MSKSTTAAVEAPKFSKECLYSANRYRDQRDLIAALLDDQKEYTIEEVDALINKFLNKEVQ